MKQNPLIILIPLLVSGCASMERSLLFGGSVGAAAGTGLGLAVEQSAGSALIGAGIGSVIGAAMGYLGHKQSDRKEGAPTGPMPSDANVPSLTTPEVRRIWNGPRVEGDRYIDGHYIYVLERPSVFIPNPEEK